MEISVLVQRIRFELIRFRFNQFLEVSIVPDGNEGLHVELKAQCRCETNVCAGGKVQGSVFEFAIDVTFLGLPIVLFVQPASPIVHPASDSYTWVLG